MKNSLIYHGGSVGRGRSYSGNTIDTDVKVKISAADTVADMLNPKISAGVGIATAILNPGGNEQLQISAPGSTTDEKVNVSGADTTPDYLVNKISLVNLSSAILNPGGDESFQITGDAPPYGLISINDSVKGYLGSKIVAGSGITTAVLNPGANEQLQINGTSTDKYVEVSATDTTPDGLGFKVVTLGAVDLIWLNPGGNEQLQIRDLGRTRITSGDTTYGWLGSKLSAGNSISLVLLNPGGDEKYQVNHTGQISCSMNDSTAGYLHTSKLVAGTNIVLTLQNPGGNENIKIDASGGGDPVKTYTMIFNYVGAVASGTLIPAPAAGTWAGAGQGYSLGKNVVLREIHILVNRHTSYNSSDSVTFGLRRIAADGSRSSAVSSASGTFLASKSVVLSNSGGAFRYYDGGAVMGLSVAVGSDQMVFCYCSGKTANSVTGVSIIAIFEESPA